eukprot:1035783-Rhodomonas_salina.1
MNSSMAVRAASSSCTLSASVRTATIRGIMSVRVAMCWSKLESACTKQPVAFSAASLTSCSPTHRVSAAHRRASAKRGSPSQDPAALARTALSTGGCSQPSSRSQQR